MKVICFLFKILAYLWGFAAETDLCNVICRKHTLFTSGWPQSRARPCDGDLTAEGATRALRLRELYTINNRSWLGEGLSRSWCDAAKGTCKTGHDASTFHQSEGFQAPQGPSA